MLKSLLFLSLCIIIGVVSSSETPQFSFYDYFQGDWEVQRTTASLKSGEQVHEELLAHYTIEKENGTLNLIGKYFINDTNGEISNLMRVVLDFNVGGNSGSFKTGSQISDLSEDEDEDDDVVKDHSLKTLFNFDFTAHHNGMIVSQGEWLGSEVPSYYQFLIGGWDKFSISIYPKTLNQEAEITMFTGRKIPLLQEKTFFQKYGTMIMIGGFFLFNMFIQKKTRSMQEQQQQRRSESDGPQIEEVKDETAPASSPSSESTSTSTKGKKKKSS